MLTVIQVGEIWAVTSVLCDGRWRVPERLVLVALRRAEFWFDGIVIWAQDSTQVGNWYSILPRLMDKTRFYLLLGSMGTEENPEIKDCLT